MTTHRKKLIEVALPLEAINEASVRESYIYKGNPSSVHKWWAQRPLAAARAMIFASLVDDPLDPKANPDYVDACQHLPKKRRAAEHDSPRSRLFDFVESLVQWENISDEEILGTARKLIQLSTDGVTPKLLDPFAGGGSIPLEGQRLGLSSYARDLNPVAVMISKSLIEVPPRFAGMSPVNPRDGRGTAQGGDWSGTSGLVADVLYYGERIRDEAWTRIGHLYPDGPNGEVVIGWLWARTVRSPNPAIDVPVPLARSFWVAKRKGQRIWAEPHVDIDSKTLSFEVKQGTGKPLAGTVNRRGGKCIVSGSPMPFDYIRQEGRAGRMGSEMMAIVTEGKDGRRGYSPTQEHIQRAQEAEPAWRPEFPLPDNPRDFKPPNYGFTSFADLFTKRQLLALTTFTELVDQTREQILADAIRAGLSQTGVSLDEGGTGAEAYAEAVSIYLAFACNKYAMYGSSFVPWYASEVRPYSLFSRQAIPMVWDYVEVNPFAEMGGSFIRSVELVADAISELPTWSAGVATQADASVSMASDDKFLISTDPPYYDNIGYADLSDYFYIWLRRSLKSVYPRVFSTLLVPKSEELVASPYRFAGDTDAAEQHFEDGLRQAFTNMREVVHSRYPLTVYYAFKQSEVVIDENENDASAVSTGWETMLQGLIAAGFVVNGTWPIRTERGGRMISVGTNALASSIVLVCRPRPDDAPMTSRREFVNALRQELPAALKEMQSGNIAPVDLAQASIGPGMAVYSRYGKVLEPNGERLTVRTALQLINQELDAYLAEQEGHVDTDTRFAVAWFEQFGFKEGGFGQADVLARAKNTSVEGMQNAGILTASAGKVKLVEWEELDAGWDPSQDRRLTAWEATHHLIERLNQHGEEGAAMLLAKMPAELAGQARQLAYRLYSICERKGWAELARDYNALVISWSTSQERAASIREEYQQMGLDL